MTRGAPEINLVQIAYRVLRENGFDPDMPQGIERSIPREDPIAGALDLRHRPWSSIDNHDSKDLDQVEYAERRSDGAIRMLIGIAYVDAVVPRGSPIDRYAWTNTLTLYTGVHIFPMLPEELSTGRTSLLEDCDLESLLRQLGHQQIGKSGLAKLWSR